MTPKPPTRDFFNDLVAGGAAGAIAKTAVAPIERVKLILQTQDLNPRIRSGQIPRYKGEQVKLSVVPYSSCDTHLWKPATSICEEKERVVAAI